MPARAHPHFKGSLTCTVRDTISNFNTVCPHGNVTFKKTQFGHFYSLVQNTLFSCLFWCGFSGTQQDKGKQVLPASKRSQQLPLSGHQEGAWPVPPGCLGHWALGL